MVALQIFEIRHKIATDRKREESKQFCLKKNSSLPPSDIETFVDGRGMVGRGKGQVGSIRNYFRSRIELAKHRYVIADIRKKVGRSAGQLWILPITSRRYYLFSPFSPHSPRLRVRACVSSARLRPTTFFAIAPAMIARAMLSH